ncbi:MAG TPA: hypothetical protein VK498_14490 [Ferruginibacter sp.]|nr:hypothetical protein [Ferruginibacter sp.]
MTNFIKVHFYWEPYPEVNINIARILLYVDSQDPEAPGGLIFFSIKGSALQVTESAGEIDALIAASQAM